MSNEKMRAEYLAWFSINSPKLDAQADQHDSKAIAIRDMGFCIWKASRAAIVVELPGSVGVTPIGGDGIQEFEDCNGEYLRGFQVVLAIEALGLKVAK